MQGMFVEGFQKHIQRNLFIIYGLFNDAVVGSNKGVKW
jgi:hypothetical protein